MENIPINLDILKSFLYKANKNTFANSTVKKVLSTRLNSRDYHFEDGNLVYHDTYFGDRDFIGEEIVYKEQKPVWGMNYYGYIIDDNTTNKELGSFLEKSIMQEYDNIIPVRGPKEFSENNWKYEINIKGDLSRFSGEEEISKDGRVVYKLFCFGGLIR